MAAKAKQVPGVLALRVEPLDGKLIVRYDPERTNAAAVRSAIEDAIQSVQ